MTLLPAPWDCQLQNGREQELIWQHFWAYLDLLVENGSREGTDKTNYVTEFSSLKGNSEGTWANFNPPLNTRLALLRDEKLFEKMPILRRLYKGGRYKKLVRCVGRAWRSAHIYNIVISITREWIIRPQLFADLRSISDNLNDLEIHLINLEGMATWKNVFDFRWFLLKVSLLTCVRDANSLDLMRRQQILFCGTCI